MLLFLAQLYTSTMISPYSAFRSGRSHFLSYLFLLKVSPLKKSQDRYGICQMATVIKKIEVSRKVSTTNFDREKSDPYLADLADWKRHSDFVLHFFISLWKTCDEKTPVTVAGQLWILTKFPARLAACILFYVYYFLLYYPPIFNASIIFCFFYKRFFSFYR